MEFARTASNQESALDPTNRRTLASVIIDTVPFTLAHAAAAYPLRKTKLVLSALIFGTFAPDLEFFFRFAPHGPFGHSPRGLFLFCLPAAFGVFWIFHDLVKEPLAALMPRMVRERIPPGIYPMSLRQPLQLVLIAVSILIGSLTHDLWDSFTHNRRWPGNDIAFIHETFTAPVVGEVHIYKFLQYASTLLGIVVLYIWFRHWLRTAPVQSYPAGSSVQPSQIRIARVVIPIVAVIGGLARTFIGYHPLDTPRGIEIWVGIFVVATISFAWLALMLWGFTLPVRRAEDRPPIAAAEPAD